VYGIPYSGRDGDARRRVGPRALKPSVAYFAIIAALHAAGIALLLPAIGSHPMLLGIGFLAYTLGLRHAFDADHVAAIDNIVRKLVQQRRDPLGVGFYFSLGHSTVVCLMAVGVAFFARWAAALPTLRTVGGLIGTLVSGGFLVVIGIINLFILFEIIVLFRRMRRGEAVNDSLDQVLGSRGLVARIAKPLFDFVSSSRQMYPVGFVFGLGFDTASEVALLALSAGVAMSAPLASGVVALPLLFAAGMTLTDTADGVFMTRAYHWALSTPFRKIYYNLTITALSVAAALLVGSIEIVTVAGNSLELPGAFWMWAQNLDLGGVGLLLTGALALTFLISYFAWRVLRLENAPR
jgi:high-affinity nickel-transport protein